MGKKKRGRGQIGAAESIHIQIKSDFALSDLHSMTLISVHIDISTLNLNFCLITKIFRIQVKKRRLYPKDNWKPPKEL